MNGAWRRHAAGSLAATALILLPAALWMPDMRLSAMGRRHEAGAWDSVVVLFAHGEILVGVIVFLCSMVLPVVKLAGLSGLAGGVVARP